jgi:hypothetical protein
MAIGQAPGYDRKATGYEEGLELYHKAIQQVRQLTTELQAIRTGSTNLGSFRALLQNLRSWEDLSQEIEGVYDL